MSLNNPYPADIPYRQPRPRGENSMAGTFIAGLLGLAIAGNPIGAIAGGVIGNVLANQPLPLEAAIRAHFTKRGLPVIGFYRQGPQAATVLFQFQNQFWTVTGRAPDSPGWTLDGLEDWLYGEITETRLPEKLDEINAHLQQ
jgi:hypothetical protein